MKTVSRSSRLSIAKYSRIFILLLLSVALSLATKNFLNYNNILNVLRQGSLLVIMAIGMTFAMLLGKGVDLSIGSILAFTSCFAASHLRTGSDLLSVVTGVLIAVCLGFLFGVVNGVLITIVKMPAFLVTFGTREILRGTVYLFMHGRIISGFVPAVVFFGAGHLFNIPMPVVIAGAMTAFSAWILKYTRFGREIYIIGSNTSAARFAGINVDLKVILGFGISGLCASIAGIVYIARLNTAEAIIGEAFALQAIGAVAIGGTAFDGGVGNPFGTMIGALILTLLTNGMNLLNVATEWQTFVNGSIIIIAVILDKFFSGENTQ